VPKIKLPKFLTKNHNTKILNKKELQHLFENKTPKRDNNTRVKETTHNNNTDTITKPRGWIKT